MDPRKRANVVLGLAVLSAALIIAFVWVPMDTASGMIERVRRQVNIGDALAPTLAAGFLGLGGVLVALFERPETAAKITRHNIRYLFVFLAILIVGFLIMRWLGPALGGLLTEEGYRPLRDTTPWKHLGFVFGGTFVVAGLIAFIEGRVTLRGVLIGFGATLALIAVYDLPFDDLLLPPNGDV